MNLDKSSLVPSQSFEYLGLHFVTDCKVLELRAQLWITPSEFTGISQVIELFRFPSLSGSPAHVADSVLAVGTLGSLLDWILQGVHPRAGV